MRPAEAGRTFAFAFAFDFAFEFDPSGARSFAASAKGGRHSFQAEQRS
jgi:hypothetical protein